ncbi:MAG: four-helix bundle copper-binding protein [Proteobacteria bacterium]|nr:four-helix bundle copper-binding protein [Pseudomonadota bacterium]HQR04883.1 four-helix bundle copper-binding protein [Rhodocyclaceae bacterium]
MDRRNALLTASALAAGYLGMASGSTAVAAEDPAGHGNHDHPEGHGGSRPYMALTHAATHCVMFGEACIGHCIEHLGHGDTSMAACARSVEQMMAVAHTLRQLATWNSPYLPAFASAALPVMQDCETECRKHEKQYRECRVCADACAACFKECQQVHA